MASRPKTLGPVGSRLLRATVTRGRQTVSPTEAAQLLGVPPSLAAGLLARLARQGWLLRLKRGRYLILPDEAVGGALPPPDEILVAGSLVEPYYLSYSTALRFYGGSEAGAGEVYVVTNHRVFRTLAARRIGANVYRVVSLPPHKFFGWREFQVDGRRLNVATRIKAVLDCLDRPEHCGGIKEVARAIRRFRPWQVEWAAAIDPAVKMRNGAILKRLGYLLDVLGIGGVPYLAMLPMLTKGYVRLDPTLPDEGPYDRKWRVRVNVPPGDLYGGALVDGVAHGP